MTKQAIRNGRGWPGIGEEARDKDKGTEKGEGQALNRFTPTVTCEVSHYLERNRDRSVGGGGGGSDLQILHKQVDA